MRTFADNEGRQWAVDVNVGTVKRVRGLIGVDLLGVLDGTLTQRLMRDPVLLCDVVYAVCKPQADASGVSDEDFGRAMAGDAIAGATDALLGAIVDFCQSPRDRAILGRVIAATNTAMDKARDLIEHRLESGEMERAVDAALAEALRTPGEPSGSAPESSASSPGD